MSYKSKNRVKYLLQVHIIFSTKYRKSILTGDFADSLKNKFKEIAQGSRFDIEYMEVDKDHIHFLISHEPNISISQIVKKLKSESTHWAWNNYEEYLGTKYWSSKKIWTPAYFCCTVGDVSADILADYIKNQG